MPKKNTTTRARAKARFIAIAGAASVLSLSGVALKGDLSPAIAYGNTLMVFAFALLILAWIAYLKTDGLDFFSMKSKNRISAPAESWKDRVPSLGSPPNLTYQIPNQPENLEEMQERTRAEERLRNRIAGIIEEKDPREKKAEARAVALDFVLAGGVIFVFSLLFQFILG